MLLLLACSEHALNLQTKDPDAVEAHIALSPARLDYWTVAAGEETVLPFTVLSVGDALLSVETVTIEGTGDFRLVSPFEPFALEPGGSREIEVAFSPTSAEAQEARAVVASNDDALPEATVDLLGEGRVPSLQITPESWDFGEGEVPCADDVEIVLQNVGSDDLYLGEVRFSGDTALTLRGADALPDVLAPYDYATVHVDYARAVEGVSASTLEVDSNDPRGTRSATQTGAALPGGTGEDHFVAEADPPVDILFAVDQSGSMDDDAASLGEQVTAFVANLETITTAWQLGVATYDDGCLNGGVLTRATPDLAATFAAATQEGHDLVIAHDEALLQISSAAIEETAAGGCNEGFLRTGSRLHVIVVSDEPERSAEEASAWTWDWWVASMRAGVGNDDLLTISGVVDVDGCGEGDAGYAEAIAETGGARLSICGADWSAHATSLAAATVAGAWRFPLSQTPVPDTLAVAVDDAPWTTGWTYDEPANEVRFDALMPGSLVDVSYAIAGECP